MTTITETYKAGTAEKQEYITRFDIHQRIQHFFLFTSFIVLVLTGMPMKFAENAVSKWWVSVLGSLETTRLIHHGAAWVMIGVCVYHALYLIISIFFLKKKFTGMYPNKQDFINFSHDLLYFIGMRKERAQFDRYNWREKFDYFAMFWGIPVMALSGLIMMFPVAVSKIVPQWVLPVALIAHSDESMLALTWIVVVHLFFNHLVPGVFPMNPSIFTGKLSKERYMVDHPAEYKRLMAKQAEKKN